MPDVFGYDQTVNTSGSIASSQYAAVTTGSKQMLVQSVNVTYGQQVDTVTVVGDTNVYWIPGKPSGTLDISKLVGSGGFFDGWKGQTCGKISNLAVNVDGSYCNFTGTGSMSFANGVITRLTMSLGTDRLTIAQGCSIQVASLSA